MTKPKQLVGDGTWGWSAEIDGDDIVINNATATWFGGANDPLDNGQTSSGVSTKKNPKILGVALPVVSWHPSTKGSPLAFTRPKPKVAIPWRTKVSVTYDGDTYEAELLDNGPAKSAGDQCDLTQELFRKFAKLSVGVLKGVTARIHGAAKYAS